MFNYYNENQNKDSFLKNTLAENSSNDFEDVVKVKKALGKLGFYEPEERAGETKDNLSQYPNTSLFNGIKKYQNANGLTVDGVMKPKGETENSLKKALSGTDSILGSFSDGYNSVAENKKFKGLNDYLSSNSSVDNEDVLNVKKTLLSTGHYEPNIKAGENSSDLNKYPDASFFDAIKKFQNANGLTVDGIMKQGGETEEALMKTSLVEPDKEQKNSDIYKYAMFMNENNEGNTTSKSESSENMPLGESKPTTSNEPNITGKKPETSIEVLAEKLAKDTKNFEDTKKHPYLCSEGKITTGTGRNVDNKEDFMKLPWKIDGKPATTEEKEEAYKAMELKKENKKGNYQGTRAKEYETATKLRLDDIDTDKMLKEDLSNAITDARNNMKKHRIDFDKMPKSAQEAVVDMQFNMGSGNFSEEPNPNNPKSKGWPKFFDALRRGDYETAAEQSKRRQVGDNRNNDIKEKLLKASKDNRP